MSTELNADDRLFGCVDQCKEGNFAIGGDSTATLDCCQTDNCNSFAQRLTAANLAVGVAVGLAIALNQML